MKEKSLKESFKNIKRIIVSDFSFVFFLLLLLLTIAYFSVPLFVMPDSVLYYIYLKIFDGIKPISSWNITRGPSFPVIIYLGTLVLGNSMLSILTITYIFFTGFITSYYLVLRNLLAVFKVKKVRKVLVFSLFVLLIMFNPILFGYFHAFLTEFVGIFLVFVSCILCWKWLKIDFRKEKVKYILFSVLLALLLVFLWFLKQPYVTAVLFSLPIAILLSICTRFNLKDAIVRLLTFFLCIFALIMSIRGWDSFLDYHGRTEKRGYTNEHLLSNSIINGISNLRLESQLEDITAQDYSEDQYVSDKDKIKIQNILSGGSTDSFGVVRIMSPRGNLVDKMVLYYKGNNFSTYDALAFWLKVFKKHPIYVLESYFSNYLATINVYISWRDSRGAYYPIKEITNFHHENRTIGLSYMYNDDNFLWIQDYQYGDIKNLYSSNNKEIFSSNIFEVYSILHLNFFKALFILLPFLFIYAAIRYIVIFKRIDSKTKEYFNLVIILLGFGLSHTVFHAITGAVIDRYAYIVFPEVVLAIMVLLVLRIHPKKV